MKFKLLIVLLISLASASLNSMTLNDSAKITNKINIATILLEVKKFLSPKLVTNLSKNIVTPEELADVYMKAHTDLDDTEKRITRVIVGALKLGVKIEDEGSKFSEEITSALNDLYYILFSYDQLKQIEEGLIFLNKIESFGLIKSKL